MVSFDVLDFRQRWYDLSAARLGLMKSVVQCAEWLEKLKAGLGMALLSSNRLPVNLYCRVMRSCIT